MHSIGYSSNKTETRTKQSYHRKNCRMPERDCWNIAHMQRELDAHPSFLLSIDVVFFVTQQVTLTIDIHLVGKVWRRLSSTLFAFVVLGAATRQLLLRLQHSKISECEKQKPIGTHLSPAPSTLLILPSPCLATSIQGVAHTNSPYGWLQQPCLCHCSAAHLADQACRLACYQAWLSETTIR